MTDISNLPIWLKTNGQNWLAATGRAPYFCLVADSESAAEELASRALHFYERAAAKREAFTKERETVTPDYVVKKTVLGRELAA
jgi:nitrous oxide reductase accessory protein NosL